MYAVCYATMERNSFAYTSRLMSDRKPDPLPPDATSVEKWRTMTHNKPSRDALPPATGGLGITWRLLIIFGVIAAILLILNLIGGQ